MKEGRRFIRLKVEIAQELKKLEGLRHELAAIDLKEAHPRIVGSILHDFYTGIERIFRRIAEEVDGGVPAGEGWHRELLGVMSLELESIRPAVISSKLMRKLDEYLRFRHLFRNIYGFELEPRRLKSLAKDLNKTLTAFKKAMSQFNKFLDELASGVS